MKTESQGRRKRAPRAKAQVRAASTAEAAESDQPHATRAPRRSTGRRKLEAAPENAIERAGARGLKKRSNVMADAPAAEAASGPRETWSAPSGGGTAAKPSRAHDPFTVPEEVSRRFVHVGKTFYFPDGARAFTDHGRKLSTPSENTEVIRSLVSIAQSRGWKAITVSGTEAFRREAWFAASTVGLGVRGFVPSKLEQAQLARKLAGRSQVAGVDPSTQARGAPSQPDGERSTQGRQGKAIEGRLLGHGPAPYKHREGEPMSYFVKLKSASGEREVWGVDLERALRQSLSQPHIGDEISLVQRRREPVTVKRRERDERGEVIGERERNVHRNHWSIEKRSFLEERARVANVVRDPAVQANQAIAMHPELAGTYMSLRAAELASKRMRNREERTRFVEAVRTALADSVARGEPMSPVKLKEASASRASERVERKREPAAPMLG